MVDGCLYLKDQRLPTEVLKLDIVVEVEERITRLRNGDAVANRLANDLQEGLDRYMASLDKPKGALGRQDLQSALDRTKEARQVRHERWVAF